jgi:transposase-like protein
MSGRARDVRLEQFWQEAIADWQRSGGTARAYCRRRGLHEASFYSWRRILQERAADRAAAQQPKFLPIRVVADTLVEIALPTGLVVRLPLTTDATAVATLVAALRAAAC